MTGTPPVSGILPATMAPIPGYRSLRAMEAHASASARA